jgi:hypothetical protein
VLDQEDFTYLVSVDGLEPLHFREICPKDFYYAQILRNREEGSFPLLMRLLLNPDALDQLKISQTRKIFAWAVQELLEQKILTVENWLEASYHLCKQRWDQSVDWLEMQPMSKVLAMIDIVKKFAEEQKDEIKKASRKRK